MLFAFAHLFFNFAFPPQKVEVLNTQQALTVLPYFFLSIGLSFSVAIYLFNSWLAKKWIKLQWPKVILFMGTMAAAGPFGEILVGNLARFFLGQPLWMYVLLPVHNSNTSMVMSVLWPIYGFHIYCFHTALKARHDITEDSDLSLLFGIDAITVEVLVNLLTLSLFYTYIFYYLADDLWHLSTAEIFIPYVVCGYVCIKTLHFLEKKHHRVIAGIIGFIIGWSIIFIF